MRRLRGGLLAAALLVGAGCSTGPTAHDDATAATRPPSLAASTRALRSVGSADQVQVLVVSPDGVGSTGLDAAVSILLGMPELAVTAAAPDAAGTVRPLDAGGLTTRSGFPTTVVDAPPADLVAAAIAAVGFAPDLVVVGLTEGVVFGGALDARPAVIAARRAAASGTPALVVALGTEHGADEAAAGVMLRSLVDLELDVVLSPGARILDIPSCAGGLVRGPLVTGTTARSSAPVAARCTESEPEGDDDASAYGAGFAVLAPLGN